MVWIGRVPPEDVPSTGRLRGVARLLRLKTAPQPADAADGVAAALCACLMASRPKLPEMPPMRLPLAKLVK